MKTEIVLGADGVRKDVDMGTVSQSDFRDMASTYKELSKIALFDTGILPLLGSGVLAIRHCLNHTQIVVQHAPGKYYINWCDNEGDEDVQTYYLAQPWRIVIGDIKDDELLGARTFYSPHPIQTLEQPLYHVNLPNINCEGYGYASEPYGGNGVGWICLYHTGSWHNLTMGERIRALIERASGVEVYNDGNMSETDGPRFYFKNEKPEYVCSPDAWQKKSDEEGFEWTLDEDLWIPVLVTGRDKQDRHDPEGVPLTLEMAMYGGYRAYYEENLVPKPVNAFGRDDLENPTGKELFKHISSAVSKANIATTGPVKPQVVAVEEVLAENICKCCEEDEIDDYDFVVIHDGTKICSRCANEGCYVPCEECHDYFHYKSAKPFSEDEELWACNDHAHLLDTCSGCGAYWWKNPGAGIDDWRHCIDCAVPVDCSSCGNVVADCDIIVVEAKASPDDEHTMEFSLCHSCAGSTKTCACNVLVNAKDTGPLNGLSVCQPCVVNDDEGIPSYVPQSAVNVTLTTTTS